jgi:hypothetical protein
LQGTGGKVLTKLIDATTANLKISDRERWAWTHDQFKKDVSMVMEVNSVSRGL